MLKHNLLLIFRNFKRNKSTFLINLGGLSAGLACTLLIYLWVSDELHKDQFNERGDRIYQVLTNQDVSGNLITLQEGPGMLGEVLAQEMPDVELAVSASTVDKEMLLSAKDKHITGSGRFADKNFFNMFSFPLVAGDKAQVLAAKDVIVLSDVMAKRLFDTTDDIIGKSVEWQTPYGGRRLFQVSGIFHNPEQTSEPVDCFISYELFREIVGNFSWGNHHALTYVLLREDANAADFEQRIHGLVKTKDKNSNLTLFIQSYTDAYLYNRYDQGAPAGGRIEYVRLFSIIAMVILAIACINFMNLSTAKASRRVTEVGIKKAVGAGRYTLMAQYLFESLMMSLFSMIVALLIADLLLPAFNSLTDKTLDIKFNSELILGSLVIVVFTGLLAGSYPALYLSGFKPAAVLKGRFTSSLTELWARKSLVVFQFALSVIFIVAVWVVYRQIDFVQSRNLGYNRDNIVHFKLEGDLVRNKDSFVQELKNIPGVVNASSMWGSVAGITGFTTGYFNWEGRNQDEIIQFEHLGINYDMIELLDIKLAEGRSFSRDFPADTNKVILNEAAIKVMKLKDPVGKIFNLWGNDLEIIGVVKDFNFQSLHKNVGPFFLRLIPREADKIMVKIEQGKEKEVLDRIGALYAKVNPGYAFDYRFLDADYQALYEGENRVASLSKYFAGLAIFISCLGLFGLASFTAERRRKEIGIRKVMGSSAVGIFMLLSTDFTKMVVLAIVFAIPVSYFIIQTWLESFAFRIELEWWFFAGAGIVAIAIAWLTVSVQSFRAANINPATCLRNE